MSRRWPPTRRARVRARRTSSWPASAAAAKKSGGFLSAFFGGGGDDEADDSADVETASAAPAPRAKSLKPAAAAKSSNLPGIAIVAPENAQRAEIPQVADDQAPEPEKDTPETIIAALPAKEIPLPDFAPRPKADVGAQQPENVPFATADATATTEQAVATAQAPANVPFGKADPPRYSGCNRRRRSGAGRRQQHSACRHGVPTALPAELAPPPSKDVLLALADTAEQGKTATDAFSVLPSARPEPAKPDAVKAVLDEANAQVPADPSRQRRRISGRLAGRDRARPSTIRPASMSQRRARPSPPARPVPIRPPRSAPA